MLGAIAGDVIGSVYEWANIKSTKFPIFSAGCCCTDDSVLTVATADALLNGKSYRDAYQDYFHRYPNAGYGGSFVRWANRRLEQPSWGNGSAMRISPVGWARDTLDARGSRAQRGGHPRSSGRHPRRAGYRGGGFRRADDARQGFACAS